mmetsp:Transcript_8057/g.18911  ORF Transcript_8057/g.18911 Transcript_8057/m.18911 type:complete len:276 (-) Transcript_8057:550-1377(-)
MARRVRRREGVVRENRGRHARLQHARVEGLGRVGGLVTRVRRNDGVKRRRSEPFARPDELAQRRVGPREVVRLHKGVDHDGVRAPRRPDASSLHRAEGEDRGRGVADSCVRRAQGVPRDAVGWGDARRRLHPLEPRLRRGRTPRACVCADDRREGHVVGLEAGCAHRVERGLGLGRLARLGARRDERVVRDDVRAYVRALGRRVVVERAQHALRALSVSAVRVGSEHGIECDCVWPNARLEHSAKPVCRLIRARRLGVRVNHRREGVGVHELTET